MNAGTVRDWIIRHRTVTVNGTPAVHLDQIVEHGDVIAVVEETRP